MDGGAQVKLKATLLRGVDPRVPPFGWSSAAARAMTDTCCLAAHADQLRWMIAGVVFFGQPSSPLAPLNLVRHEAAKPADSQTGLREQRYWPAR